MNLFGAKKKQQRAPDAAETIMGLRQNLETLDKREAHISRKMDAAVREAKEKLARKDKTGAMFVLKRKKMYEAEVHKIHGARITLESQIMSLESAALNIETFRAMESGAQAMRGIRGKIDAETVDEMLDDIDEEKQIMDQIGDAISRPAEDMFDDDELLREIEAMEEQAVEEQMLAPAVPTSTPQAQSAAATPAAATSVPAAAVPDLPAAPTAPVSAIQADETTDEDDLAALRELEAQMAVR